MTDRPALVRALMPLTGAVPLVRGALANGALRVRRGRIVSPDPPSPPLVQVTRADGTRAGSPRAAVPGVDRPASDTGHADAHCDLCQAPLGPEHAHLVDVESRSLQCACQACRLLFTPDGAGAGHLRLVPDRYEPLGELEAVWQGVDLPVSLAFLMKQSGRERITIFYPSPAGATESLLPVDAWQDWVTREPRLATLEPETEALLIRRPRGSSEAFIVPVDACYELVGIIRQHWRGFDGGDEARTAIDRFFARVRARSAPRQESLAPA